MDLPPSRQEFEQIRGQLRPDTSVVLQILESPVLGIHAFDPVNTSGFDAVLTYEHPEAIKSRTHYFHYHLPNQLRQPRTNMPFEERKGVVLINGNRVKGFLPSANED
ncbi:MAG: hypothetical protein VKL42_14965 [Snowella sp.]|nr:hypothetical protein [Snowella sp.]